MLRLLVILQIILFSIISSTKTYAQSENLFESLKGTDENPLLDLKYNIELEPFVFDPDWHNDVAFRTYICYNASYADGSTKTGKIQFPNFRFGFIMGSFQTVPPTTDISCLEAFNDRKFLEEEKVFRWYNKQSILTKGYISSWTSNDFYHLKNISQSKTIIRPNPTCFIDDISRIEVDTPYPYSNGFFEIFPNLNDGYILETGSHHYGMAQFGIHNPIIRAKDGYNTIIRLNSLEIKRFEISLENHGNKNGYMETIEMYSIIELSIDGTTISSESDILYHFDYPQSDELKQAAREAGYDIP